MRLLRDNQVENSLNHFFLNYSVEDNNLICIASVRFSSVYTCGLPVPFSSISLHLASVQPILSCAPRNCGSLQKVVKDAFKVLS